MLSAIYLIRLVTEEHSMQFNKNSIHKCLNTDMWNILHIAFSLKQINAWCNTLHNCIMALWELEIQKLSRDLPDNDQSPWTGLSRSKTMIKVNVLLEKQEISSKCHSVQASSYWEYSYTSQTLQTNRKHVHFPSFPLSGFDSPTWFTHKGKFVHCKKYFSINILLKKWDQSNIKLLAMSQFLHHTPSQKQKCFLVWNKPEGHISWGWEVKMCDKNPSFKFLSHRESVFASETQQTTSVVLTVHPRWLLRSWPWDMFNLFLCIRWLNVLLPQKIKQLQSKT